MTKRKIPPARRKKTAKTAAAKAGRVAEMVTALYLRAKGYRIITRNLQTPVGEIDIVARRGNLLVFVEVKYRNGFFGPEVIANRQWQRIARAAAYMVGRTPALQACVWRFDAVLLTPWRWPRHARDLWRPE
jgi:putative endonuclease